jgi:hypothetical protein
MYGAEDPEFIRAQDGLVQIIRKRVEILLGICRQYAARALKQFHETQPNEQLKKGYWTNRTMSARNMVFPGTEITKEFVSFFLAHGVEYGIKLELGHDRRFEALRPIVYSLYDEFISTLKEVFGDDN